MSLLPQIEGGYLVNQGMLLQVDDVDVDVVDLKGGRRPKKKNYNYELFQPKVLPNLTQQQQQQKRKLRSQSHENASTGSEEDNRDEEQSKKRKDVNRSKSLASTERHGQQLSQESRSIFTKYASVAKAEKRKGQDEHGSSFKNHAKSRSSDSPTSQHVRFDDRKLESYPEVIIKEKESGKPPPKQLKPIPGYLKTTHSSGNKIKHDMDPGRPLKPIDKTDEVAVSDYNEEDADPLPRRPTPSRFKASNNGSTHRERLHEERRRARLWRETASDPGKTEKSIQNDQVIKGRTSQNRRRNPNGNKHDDRPRGADRTGRRMQSLPSRKEPHDAEDRPVNSAPSKELPKSEGPMPKVNTLVRPSPGEVKESPKPVLREPKPVPSEPKPVPSEPKPQPPPKAREPVVESKPVEKPKPVVNETAPPKRSSVQIDKPKVVIPAKKSTDSSDGTPAPSEEKKPKIQLPPDDHGPINTPVVQESKKRPSESSKSTEDENFKYYASQKEEDERQSSQDHAKEKTSPALLRFQAERSRKADRGRDVSPTKYPGRGRDFSPSKSPRRDQSPGKYLRRIEKAKTMTERTEPSEHSEASRKKREVTIMDPKDVGRELDIEGEERAFPAEYEIEYHRRSKTFEQMTDEEKVDYFKKELKLRPEQIRELTFHPKVTKAKQIHRAYTGMDTVKWRQKSARLKSARRTLVYRKVQTVAPSQRKSYMLSKLQGVVYRHINKVYGASSKNVREKQFFERLANLQLKEYQKRYEMLEENEQKQLETKYKQREQLRRLRKKFEDDAWRRFMTQYVTSKVMESEYRDRSEYGLPNELPGKAHASRNRRHVYTMTPKSRYRSNRKKYANLFNFNAGPELKQKGKPLKFEGFDAIYIDTEDENGSPTKKRQDVQALMAEAMDLLQAHDDEMDMDDPRSSRRPVRKQSEPLHRRYERPKRSVSRVKRNSEPHSVKTFPGSKPFKLYTDGQSVRGPQRYKPKPKAKTIKELYSKRAPAQSNRYKASAFNSMKQNLLKDSERLDKKLSGKDRTSSKSDDAKSASQLESEKSEGPRPSERHKPPDIAQAKPPNAVKSLEGKPEKNNVYLDEAKTQMEVDSEREKSVKDKHKSPVPARDTQPATSTTTTTTTVTTTTTRKVVNSPEKKTGDTDSVSETVSVRQERRGSITSQRRGSVPSIQPNQGRRPVSRTPSMATVQETGNRTTPRPVQRAPSRASILSVSQNPRPGVTQLSRAPSRASIMGEEKRSVSRVSVRDDTKRIGVNGVGTGRSVSRLSTVTQKEQKSVPASQKDQKHGPVSNGVANGDDNKRGVITVSDANSKQEEPVVNGTTAVNGSAGSPMTVALGSNDGRVSPIVSMTANKNDEERNSTSRRPSIRSNRINFEQQKPPRQKSPSPSFRSRLVNGESPVRKLSHDSKPKAESQSTNGHKPNVGSSVDVKKTEHVSEVVTEIVQNQRKDRSRERDDASGQSRKPSENKTSPTQSKSGQGRVSKRDSKDDRRSSIISQVRDANLVNGHGDTKMKREDYEKRSEDRQKSKTPTRSRSQTRKGRKRSTSRSRERKGSSTRDKKTKGKGKSTRFPDIENRPNSMARVSPAKDQTQTHVSKNVKTDETVTERELTPTQGGADQWRDLVQKYMRQPSPTINKPANRALLDASFDTDDDDDDIFARAQKRYALSISDAESGDL